jgi:hypothetical protein
VFDEVGWVVVADVLQRCCDGVNKVFLLDRGHGEDEDEDVKKLNLKS